MKKIGRNDPCHCGSGQKFKKCCESKMIGGRYMATKLDPASQHSSPPGLTSLFAQNISMIARPESSLRSMKAVLPKSPSASEVPLSKPSEKIE